MLDNKQLFGGGLCSWIGVLFYDDIINEDEYNKLTIYIQENRPSKYSSFQAYERRNSAFYWHFGNIKPRIKWLKKHIAKN